MEVWIQLGVQHMRPKNFLVSGNLKLGFETETEFIIDILLCYARYSGAEHLHCICGFSWAIACACFTVLVTSTITTSTHSVTDIPIVSHITTTTASTSLPDRIITHHTDITNNTVHRQPSYNISTGGDNSNLCSNGSSTAASAGISAFWYLVVLSAGLVFFICGWYWNI